MATMKRDFACEPWEIRLLLRLRDLTKRGVRVVHLDLVAHRVLDKIFLEPDELDDKIPGTPN